MTNIITDITAQKKNKHRINIFIDNQYAFSVNSDRALNLKTGDEISQNQVNQLKKADETDKAFNLSLYFLKFRPRSRTELIRYLKDKNFTAEAVTETINRLETEGLTPAEILSLARENSSALVITSVHGLVQTVEDMAKKGARQ